MWQLVTPNLHLRNLEKAANWTKCPVDENSNHLQSFSLLQEVTIACGASYNVVTGELNSDPQTYHYGHNTFRYRK